MIEKSIIKLSSVCPYKRKLIKKSLPHDKRLCILASIKYWTLNLHHRRNHL